MFRNIFSCLAFLVIAGVAVCSPAWSQSPTDKAIQAALQKELAKKVKPVRVEVEDRVATLTGTVDSYLEKLAAERIAHKYQGLAAVTNHIIVGGVTIPDADVARSLARKLVYDRSMQGNVFDAFLVEVKDGIVTLSGYAHNYLARNSAIAIAESEKGVKGVLDKIRVLPLSRADDEIRITAARRIYSNAGLQKYAMDPAHPIRIVVENGNVTLSGVVLSQLDKQLAGTTAAQIAGAFSITNNLQVEEVPDGSKS